MRRALQKLRRIRGRRPTERGMALMLVVIAIAILTVVATEFAYNSRVDLQTAANHRDETRAYFLARSGIGLSRLLLKFQKQLDSIKIPNLGDLLGKLGGLGGGAAPGQGQTPQPSSVSLQLWRMAKVDCHMLQAMVSEKGREAESEEARRRERPAPGDEAAAIPMKSFGGFEGCFDVKITDEEERINLNKLDAPALSSQVLLKQTLATFGDKRYEFLFEREDANRVRVTPTDTIIAMRDWVDQDEVQAALNFSGQGEPFARGFSDENGHYDRYDPRYRAKNARFDSLDELYLVHGVNDAFMAAFRDKLTVYPDLNSRMNINTDDPLLLELAIKSIADPLKPDPRLNDPLFIEACLKRIRSARVFSMFGMSVTDFTNIVANGCNIAVNSSILNNSTNQRFIGDNSTTYRLQAVGEAGAVRKTITAVVRLNEGLGTLVYWREE